MGTRAVEGITFDISKASDLHLSSHSLERMTCLRYLEVYGISDKCNIYFPDGLGSLSDKFCLESLPSTFRAEKLVEIHMPSSKLKMLWNGVQNLVNLKKINLGFSKHLIEVPDLSRAANLETVDLRSCESLNQLCPSVLKRLDLSCCYHLKKIPDSIKDHHAILRQLVLDDCRDLVYLPDQLSPYLQHLSAFNCISLEKDFTQHPVPEHVKKLAMSLFSSSQDPDGFSFITGEASITLANMTCAVSFFASF